MSNIYRITFIGDWFATTVNVEAPDDVTAIAWADGLLEDQYGWNVKDVATVSIDIEVLESDEVRKCVDCDELVALPNGALCDSCYKYHTRTLWDEE